MNYFAGLANRTDETAQVVVHHYQPATPGRISCRVISLRHVHIVDNMLEMIGREDYWHGSRVMIGMDKDGRAIFAVSSYDSGEGTYSLQQWLGSKRVTVTEYIHGSILYSEPCRYKKRDAAQAIRLLRPLLRLKTIEQRTVVNGFFPGTYRGRELFGNVED